MMSHATKSSRGSRFSRFMKAPIRVLIKARDFYIKSMTECSSRFDYGGMAMGCPAAQVPSALPRSFSTSFVKSSSSSSSNNDDYRELIRAASARSTFAYMETLGRKQQMMIDTTEGGKSEMMMNRSRSVGIGRIDEDKACEFGEEEEVVNKKSMYPRSRSYAVARRTTS